MPGRTSELRRQTRRESGQVLIVALVTALLVGVAASLVAASLALEARHAIAEGKRVRLTAIADAAVAEALAHLSVDQGFPGEPEGELGGGSYESSIHNLGPGLLEIRVVARVGGRQRRVRVVARLRHGGPRVELWQRLSPTDP